MNVTDLQALPPFSDADANGYTTLPNRLMGEILIEDVGLEPNNIEKILKLQFERNLLFGDAGIRLGLVSRQDVERALARQFGYPYIIEGECSISEELVTAYHPGSTEAEEVRTLRNQLLLNGFGSRNEKKIVAIVGAGRGEGRSFIAANLAVSFAQQGQRTLLIDGDMRNSRQHLIFNLRNSAGLSAALSGRNSAEIIQRVKPFMQLHVLTAGSTPPNPLELLGRPSFHHLLERYAREFDILLIDTPEGAQYADVQTIAKLADGVLLVVRKNESRIGDARRLTERIARSDTFIIGVALNDF